jgi:hypothetical protein
MVGVQKPRASNGAPIVLETRAIQCSVKSDAATETLGWYGVLTLNNGQTFTTRGHFTTHEREMHINALELLGCFYIIRSLLPQAIPDTQWSQVHLNCQLDNVVAIKYARVAVSRSLALSKLGAQFYDWAETAKIQMSFRHLAGIYNVEADSPSRREWQEIEWQLNRPWYNDCRTNGNARFPPGSVRQQTKHPTYQIFQLGV